MNTTPEDLAEQLVETLTEYGKTTSEEVTDIIESVGKEARDRVKDASPRRKGAYKRGWKFKVEKRGNSTKITVYNAKYMLTHLLEFGHRTRFGTGKRGRTYGRKTFVSPQPHIAPVNDWAQSEFERRLRKKLGGG